MGYCYISDPDGKMTGRQELTGIDWYKGDPDLAENLITNDTEGYMVNIPGGADYTDELPDYALVVEKNYAENTGTVIWGVVRLTDLRTGNTVKDRDSVTFSTTVYDDLRLSMTCDRGQEWTVDPLVIDETPDERWPLEVTAQLRSCDKDCAGSYLWVRKEGQEWRMFNDYEIGPMVTNISTKTLRVYMERVEDLTVRCYAVYKEDGGAPWMNPFTSGNQNFVEVHLHTKVNGFVTPDVEQTEGIHQVGTMDEEVAYKMRLTYNLAMVPESKYGLFKIEWHAWGTGVADKVMGYGPTLRFRPSDYGFTKHTGLNVSANVYMQACEEQVYDEETGTELITADDDTQDYLGSEVWS